MSSQPHAQPTGRHVRSLSLWGPVVLYCAVIFFLSSLPNLPPLPGRSSDKIAHALLYSGLGFLAMRAFLGAFDAPGYLAPLLATLLLVGLYGMSDEIHQLFVPHRVFDLRDLAADVVGGGLGAGSRWLCDIIAPRSGGSRVV